MGMKMLFVTRQEKKLRVMKKETCMMKDGRHLGGNVLAVMVDKGGLRMTMDNGTESMVALDASDMSHATVPVSAFEAVYKIEVTGDFRGFWHDAPVYDKKGIPIVDEYGVMVVRRQFKLCRGVRFIDHVVLQVAWISESAAKAHSLVDGLKYNITLSVGKSLVPSEQNGMIDYLDEYAFTDVKIVSVNGLSAALCKVED